MTNTTVTTLESVAMNLAIAPATQLTWERRIAFYIKAKYSFDKRNKATEHDKHDRHHSRKRREVVDVVELVDDESVSNDSDNNSTDRERRIAFYIKTNYSFDKRNKAAEQDKHDRHHSRKRR